jgi:hypothetical protein
MNDPIPISREAEPPLTAADILAVEKQRYQQRIGWTFLLILGIGALALLTPLVVWLTRLAGGG